MTILGKLLKTKARVALKDIVHKLVDDISINTVVTYKQHLGGTTFDPEAQAIGSSRFKSYKSLNALKTYFTDFERVTSGGEIELGDVRFIVFKDDLTNVSCVPNTEDKILETRDQSGVTYGIVDYSVDPLGLAFVFHCRRS